MRVKQVTGKLLIECGIRWGDSELAKLGLRVCPGEIERGSRT